MLFIFDMGGVVTNTFKFDMFFEKLNLSKEQFFKIVKEDSNIWNKLETGAIDVNSFWKEFNNLSHSYGIPEVKHDLFRLYFHPSKMMKTVELIQKLKKKHRVVCGTNTIQSHWENHLERGDYALFNQTYASNKIGAAKPDTLFWKLIMEAEGFSPKETFFTDDKEENCKAAESLGINTVHFSTSENLIRQWEKYC